jgi:hypothetical protein
VPQEETLNRLKAAARYQVTELTALLGPRGLDPGLLDRLTLPLGSCRWRGEPWANPLSARPLVRYSDELIVAAPGALLSALLRSVLALASEKGLLEPQALAFRRAIYASAEASLDLLGSRPLGTAAELSDLPACEGIFSLDSRDKVVHLLLISDDLHGCMAL